MSDKPEGASDDISVDDSSTVVLPSSPSSGKRLPALGRVGRYVLERPLGRGGMAEVFLARQEGPSSFSKRVVLKRIHRALLGDERYVQMFLREARIAARLNHTNLVQVFELGEDNEDYYLAMEHIDGLTLQKAARRAWASGMSVPMEVALRAVADAARGLHYAHTLRDDDGNDISLVHRDISPDNLMLTRDGVTKVLDFGIAKSHDGDAMTTDGELKGKIPFLSPEQIAGQTLDGRSDLWALGVTLYWLLTGKRPFHAHNDIATLQAIMQQQPTPPRDLNPLVPPALQALVLDLLQKDRELRIKDGAELSNRLLVLLGPAAAGPESAEFARTTLTLPDDVANAPRTMTLAASRPHTEWLQRPTTDALSDEHGATAPSTAHTIAAPSLAPATAAPPSRAPLAIGAAFGAALIVGVFAYALLPTATTATATTATAATTTAMVPGAPTTAPAVGATTSTPPVAPTATAPAGATVATAASIGAPPPAPTVGAIPAAPPDDTPTSPSARPVTTTPPVAARPQLQVKAPAHVRWETEKGARLGAGTAGLVVPQGTKRIVARDGRRGGRIVVDVAPGTTVDWDALPRGRLDVRVEPYAEVLLGTEKLGTTPFAPLPVVAGSYTVILIHESQRVEKTIDVSAGRDTRVSHRF
jgi:serine/threonine protein kinase